MWLNPWPDLHLLFEGREDAVSFKDDVYLYKHMPTSFNIALAYTDGATI
jgi:hypothetical protein